MERVRILIGRVAGEKVEIQQGEAWVPADDVVILGAGKGDSSGFVLVGQFVSHYITNTQVDAGYMLAKMADIADKIAGLGDVETWAIPSVGVAVNAEARAVGQQAKAIADELREYKLK